MLPVLPRYRAFRIPLYSGTPSALHNRQPQLVNLSGLGFRRWKRTRGSSEEKMSDVVINPGREKNEPRLPATGLLCVNPTEAKMAARLAREKGARQQHLFNSSLFVVRDGSPDQQYFTAGPAVGAPMAVLTLEKLIALGARRVIVYGWCGSLQESLTLGDVLLPTWAVSSEGTSVHYPSPGRLESSRKLREELAGLIRVRGIEAVTGPVWTTDAPYRETRAAVTVYRERSIMAVDMEYAALCAVAAFRDIELAAVFLVSDETWSQPWQAGFTHKSFKKKSNVLLESLVDFCASPGD
jgi:uridine phosphorylase